MNKYANIIIDISHESVDRAFQYKIPDELQEYIQIGQEVIVPFGRGNKGRKGYVIELTDQPEYDVEKLKFITDISQKTIAIEGQLIALAAWMRQTYGCTMIQALKTVLPVKDEIQRPQEQLIELTVGEDEAAEKLEEYKRKHYLAKARLLEQLIWKKTLTGKQIRQELNISTSTLQAMTKEGIIAVRINHFYRNPVEEGETTEEYELTPLQKKTVTAIHERFKDDKKRPFLLHGITGSGKTEVYVELVDLAAKQGRQSIVLIPEIALTKQTVMRFYKRFGERVSIIHSRLSKGERYDQFERAKNGEIDVIIGPRSALFTPFSNLGYIIIDEEHEESYKSETMPKYHARETAIKRAEMSGATVVLASATPSVDSYYQAKQGIYTLLEMKERISKQGLAQAEIIDLRTELREGNRSIFSRKLAELMEERLQKHQQTLLFINRRGYHGFVSCRSCGKAIMCPNCDVTLSQHANGRLQCHYCGFEQAKVTACPSCGSKYIGGFRVGTEQVEEMVKVRFPQARVLRMDMDTTRKKHGHDRIVEAFRKQEADILIGTQMIVKGHDFPNVTLVGILAADMSLQVGHYRSAERTFQLLTQAAGRAGRGSVAGEVVIQTYNPEHYSIRFAKEQDYLAFYGEEIKYRALSGYPPVGNVMELFLSADDENIAEQEIKKISSMLREYLETYIELKHEEQLEQLQMPRLIGPAPAAIAKLQNRYRRVIYIKSMENTFLVSCRDWLEQNYQPPEEIQLQFDLKI